MTKQAQRIGLLLGVLLSVAPSARADKIDQLNQIFGYFGSTCPSQGEWTKAAVGQAEAIISVLRAVEKDPNCQSLSGAVGQVELLRTRINDLSGRTEQRQILQLQRKQQELLLALSQSQDPSLEQTIRSELDSTQISLAGYLGSQDAGAKLAGSIEFQEATQSLVANTNILMSQALASQSCLMAHPSILSGIGALAGSIAASVTTSGASLGLAAATQLLGSVTEYVRKAKLDHQINLVSQSITANAYQCVLESISAQWCAEQDALAVIELKAKSLKSEDPDDQLWAGVKLLDRDLPVFLSWLEKVRLGADPSTAADADRQQLLFKREAAVKSGRALGIGILSEESVLFQQATNAKDQWLELRATITKLQSKVAPGENDAGNPLTEIHNYSYLPYFLLGLQVAEVPKSSGGYIIPFSEFDPFTQWPRPGGFKPDMEVVRSGFTSWVDEASNRIDKEIGAILQPDPLKVMNDAITEDLKKRSPAKALRALQVFMNAHPPNIEQIGTHARLYEDTKSRLDEIFAQIEKVLVPGSSADPKLALAEVYRAAALDHGLTLLSGRLVWAIRMSLNNLIDTETGISHSTATQLLAADDVIDELQRFSKTSDLSSMAHDVKTSQLVTEETLSGFTQLFGKDIRKVAQSYFEKAKTDPRYEEQRGALCLKLLASPSWPKDIPMEYCQGAQLHSIFPKGPNSVEFTPEEARKPLSDRACHFRNFFRANRIYENHWDSTRSGSN